LKGEKEILPAVPGEGRGQRRRRTIRKKGEEKSRSVVLKKGGGESLQNRKENSLPGPRGEARGELHGEEFEVMLVSLRPGILKSGVEEGLHKRWLQGIIKNRAALRRAVLKYATTEKLDSA